LRAMRVKILRHVVPAGPGSENQCALALPRGPIIILMRMDHLALERVDARKLDIARDAIDAIGENKVPGPENAFRAIGAAHPRIPMAGSLVITASDKRRAGP